MMRPVILDIDASLGDYPGQIRVALQACQETLRFACSRSALVALRRELDRRLPDAHGTVLFGSGDFHHLSWPLIERCAALGPFEVVVLDNHPDNMRFPVGVHCGSWVSRVATLPFVRHVHVVGITSTDIGLAHAVENALLPLLRGRLTYWSTGVDVRWARRLGLAERFRSFGDIDTLVSRFVSERRRAPAPTYLSIDKDVFSTDLVQTNWDQGRMRLEHARSVISALGAGIVGSDINGEVSQYTYRRWWKRRLAALDGQDPVASERLAEWRRAHHALNLALLDAIAGSGGSAQANRTSDGSIAG